AGDLRIRSNESHGDGGLEPADDGRPLPMVSERLCNRLPLKGKVAAHHRQDAQAGDAYGKREPRDGPKALGCGAFGHDRSAEPDQGTGAQRYRIVQAVARLCSQVQLTGRGPRLIWRPQWFFKTTR